MDRACGHPPRESEDHLGAHAGAKAWHHRTEHAVSLPRLPEVGKRGSNVGFGGQ